jgi:transcriptional regulator with XRE-family HTH domain
MKKYLDLSEFVDTTTEQSVKENLRKRFKLRRKECGITQKELTASSGVSYASIRRFETTGDISLSSLINLANAIGCLEDFNRLFDTPIIKDLKNYKND